MKKKTSLNFKIITFWVGIIAVTAIFLALFINNRVKVRVFDSMSDIDRAGLLLEGDEVTKQEGTYYVYIYSLKESQHDLNKLQELEPAILNYFTFVSLECDETPIYGYCVDDFSLGYQYESVYGYLQTLNKEINFRNAPLLIKVSNGSVSSVYTTQNKIESELQSAMNHNHDHDHDHDHVH